MTSLARPTTPAWVRALPKVELHAHLSGSIRSDTICRLLNKPGNEAIRKQAGTLFDQKTGRTLKHCFDIFPIIHNLVTDAATLHSVVIDVLHDFANDNTVYLELRTTLRESSTLSAEDYLLTVLKAIATYHAEVPNGLVCRLLISISRHLSVEEAKKAVGICEKVMNLQDDDIGGLLVGMELSGNPHKGRWEDFRPILEDARERLGLPISLHFGEVFNEAECQSMLDFEPNRIGHAVLVSRNVVQLVLKAEPKIGIEVCLTSNLMTNSIPTASEHPVVKHWIPSNHPFCLCTDDSGVFETTLSDEYARLIESVDLRREAVRDIAMQGLNLAFRLGKDTKERILMAAQRIMAQ